jgi:hypothetical protein
VRREDPPPSNNRIPAIVCFAECVYNPDGVACVQFGLSVWGQKLVCCGLCLCLDDRVGYPATAADSKSVTPLQQNRRFQVGYTATTKPSIPSRLYRYNKTVDSKSVTPLQQNRRFQVGYSATTVGSKEFSRHVMRGCRVQGTSQFYSKQFNSHTLDWYTVVFSWVSEHAL